MLKIALGSDHAGFDYKSKIIDHLKSEKIYTLDFGTFSTDSVDYPDFVHPTVQAIIQQEADWGILICGSGNGVCMTANKYPEIRAALCWDKELSALARAHNNANILCIPSRFVSLDLAIEMVDVFLKTDFEGGRHQRRIDKMKRD